MMIKQVPEDFEVTEIADLKTDGGDYAYYRLVKRGWNTLDAIRKISELSGKDRKLFGYAGNKDKNAITTQYFSCFQGNKDLENLKIDGLRIEYLGKGKERINLGDLNSNEFRIVVRGLEKEIKIKERKMLNLFDEQRFGFNNENAAIGKLVIRKRFKEACEKLNLKIEDNSPINSLRKIERKELRLYLNSYQSYLWNELARKLKEEHETIPLVGYLTKYDGEIKKEYETLLKRDGITKQDFMIRSYPEMSMEGNERKMYIELENLDVKYENDELNNGKKKAIVTFRLGKGQYGTLAVKELFGENL